MANQVRDHAAEYRRRIERGLSRGLTRSQARGHPKVREALASGRAATPSFDPKLEAALKRLYKPGASVTAVAKEAKVGRERLSSYIKAVAGATREGRRWTFDDQRIRRLAVIEAGAGRPITVRVRGFQDAHIAGAHAYEAGEVLTIQELYPEFLRRWQGVRIRDVSGQWHTLSTDPNEIYQATYGEDNYFERFYRIEH